MQRLSHILLLPAILAAAIATAGAEETWTKIRRGMTEDEVAAAVGIPLMAKAARGYRHWFYDREGAVMFNSGVVVFWSVPRDFVPPATPVETTRTPPKKAGPVSKESADKAAHLKSMAELAAQKPLVVSTEGKNPSPTPAASFQSWGEYHGSPVPSN